MTASIRERAHGAGAPNCDHGREDRTMSETAKDRLIELSVGDTKAPRTRVELTEEEARRLGVSKGDTVTVLAGKSVAQLEHDLAVERWVGEGDREFGSLDELFDYIDRCPSGG
jgi:hypothetical protein